MKEILNIFIGQAGVQQGNAAWELLCIEHGVSPGGLLSNDELSTDGIDRLFSVVNEVAHPLTLIIDTESNVIDQIRSGDYRECFDPYSFISGQEDAQSLFSRGYFGEGRQLIDRIKNRLEKVMEKCDSLDGLCIWHSVGGGTGSGLYSLLMDELECLTKLVKVEMITYPSYNYSPVIVEPYNSILAQHYTLDSIDISFMVDNEALYKIVNSSLNINFISYSTINNIVAQLYNYVTAAVRFKGAVSNLMEIIHNLIPYPRIHYPVSSLSTLTTNEKDSHLVKTIKSLTISCLVDEFNLISCKPCDGFYMACCLLYRGQINTSAVHEYIRDIKSLKTVNFIDWCPTGIKVIICDRPAYIQKNNSVEISPISVAVLSNNSSVIDPMLRNIFHCYKLFQKRSFVHWFVGEGLEERDFQDGLENIACLIADYGYVGDTCIKGNEKEYSNTNLKKENSQMKLGFNVKFDFKYSNGGHINEEKNSVAPSSGLDDEIINEDKHSPSIKSEFDDQKPPIAAK